MAEPKYVGARMRAMDVVANRDHDGRVRGTHVVRVVETAKEIAARMAREEGTRDD